MLFVLKKVYLLHGVSRLFIGKPLDYQCRGGNEFELLKTFLLTFTPV